MGKVTVNDIALRLNIAQGTVSKALGKKKGVGEALRRRILETAEEMGYEANKLAQGLARKPMHVCYIRPDIWNSFYRFVDEGIRNRLSMYGDYKIDLVQMGIPKFYCDEELDDCIDRCIEAQTDVVLIAPAYNALSAASIRKLRGKGIPYILMGTDLQDDEPHDCICVDADCAGQMAAQLAALVMRGSRKAAVMIGNQDMQEHRLKKESFIGTLRDSGCSFAGSYDTLDIPAIASIITETLISQTPDLEMIYVATSNSVAVCKTLDRLDPERKVRIIATDLFEDMLPYMESGRIIATVYQNPKRMGELAMEKAFSIMFSGDHALTTEYIQPELILPANMRKYL